MCNECLTKPCDICGKTITGANWHCNNCGICICLFCGDGLRLIMNHLECPGCGKKLD